MSINEQNLRESNEKKSYDKQSTNDTMKSVDQAKYTNGSE